MLAGTNSFRGEAPRITPRALPDNASAAAINARLKTGDLEAWANFQAEHPVELSGEIRSIYLLARQYWLTWNEDVQVARGIIPGDTTYRTYLTGLDVPRFTTLDLATTGPEPYPVETRPIGVPVPDEVPLVAVEAAQPTDSGLPINNPGAESGTVGWTVTTGALVAYTNGDIAGLNAQAGTRFFGSSAVAETEAEQAVSLGSLGVVSGQGLTLTWYQATGPAGSTAAMGMRFFDAGNVLLAQVEAPQEAPDTALTWEQRQLSAVVPDSSTTVEIYQRFVRVGGGDLDAYIDTITLNAVSYGNAYDGSTLAGWTTSPNQGTTSSDRHRMVMIDNTVGWPPPSFFMRGDERTPFFYRDFSTNQGAGVVVQFDYDEERQRGTGLHVLLFASQEGAGASIAFSSNSGVRVYGHSSWDSNGGAVETIPTLEPLTTFQRYTVTLTATKTNPVAARVVVRVVNATTGVVVVDNAEVTIQTNGSFVGFKGGVASLHNVWHVDNLTITVSPPNTQASTTTTATAYVYTFVNDLGEESGPSPASQTILKPESSSVTVTTPTSVASGLEIYNVTHKRIYRAVTGVSGTVFRFVAEIPLTTPSYNDQIQDSQLGEVLETEGWDLPPSDLRGIIALPNGIMAGYRRNQLCLSVQNRPHAWRVADRLNTDTDITGIGNIDTTVVLGTESFPYVAYGSTPESYTMAKLDVPQSCTSARGVANLKGFGVAMPSPDGYLLVAGPGQVQNLTETIFTREQWQALDPSSILAVAHDDVLFFFWDNGSERGGYALDMKPTGAGLITLSFHATAAHADPISDNLFLVLDQFNSLDVSGIPAPPADPDPDGRTIYRFNANGPMTYSWASKVYLTRGVAAQYGRIHADSYDNLLLQVYGDGNLVAQLVITSDEVFTLPANEDYRTFQYVLIGTDPVQTVAFGDDLDQVLAATGG
jgi:hypothetical protein